MVKIKYWQILKCICNHQFVCPCCYEGDALQMELGNGKIEHLHLVDHSSMDKQQAYWLARCYVEFRRIHNKDYKLAEELILELKEHA